MCIIHTDIATTDNDFNSVTGYELIRMNQTSRFVSIEKLWLFKMVIGGLKNSTCGFVLSIIVLCNVANEFLVVFIMKIAFIFSVF